MVTQAHDLEESKEEMKEEGRMISVQTEGDRENAYLVCEICKKYFNLSDTKPS